MNSPEQAQAVLQTQVYNRAFFEKLSRDWNIVPKNAVEQQQLLEIAHRIKLAKAQTSEKQASTGNPFLATALDGLTGALREEGVDLNAQSTQNTVKEAAFNLTQDPEIAHAGLALAEFLVANEQGNS